MVKTTPKDLCYQQHRMRVQNAKSVVNSNPPLKKEPEAPYKELTYIEMLTTLRRDLGRRARTFTKSPERLRQRQRQHQLQQQQQQHYYHHQHHCSQMHVFGNQLASLPEHEHMSAGKSCPAFYSTHSRYRDRDDEHTNNMSTCMLMTQAQCGIPEHVLQRYNFLASPRNVGTLHRLLRPRLFLDLEVKDMRPLGRVVIQLYTEACPEVVLEFVRTCLAGNQQRIHFTRLLPPLWLEGELALDDNKALTAPNVEHDLEAIDHGSSAGILSFPSRYVRGVCKRRSLNFTISFKPINALNGKRIAFGKVKRGTWILDTLQDYRTKNGKPLHEISVLKCGLVQ